MAKRKIVKIDEAECNGCGLCIPNCYEGALQLIDNKARLISDLFCDGLGNCLGHCPEGAIEIIEREAEPYDEKRVMKENIVPKGVNTIKAHLEHLKDHGADKYLQEALNYINKNNISNPLEESDRKKNNEADDKIECGCPGAKMMDFSKDSEETNNIDKGNEPGQRSSHLKQWPVQLHLASPQAPYFNEADLLFAADCTAFALGDFHKDFMKGKSLAIACPKLDNQQEIYVDKLISMIDDAKINTLTVAIMEVPCCGGLIQIAKRALGKTERKIPVKAVTVGIKGEILSEEWFKTPLLAAC